MAGCDRLLIGTGRGEQYGASLGHRVRQPDGLHRHHRRVDHGAHHDSSSESWADGGSDQCDVVVLRYRGDRWNALKVVDRQGGFEPCSATNGYEEVGIEGKRRRRPDDQREVADVADLQVDAVTQRMSRPDRDTKWVIAD